MLLVSISCWDPAVSLCVIHSLFPKMWLGWARADGLCWAPCPGPGGTAVDGYGAASLMVFF